MFPKDIESKPPLTLVHFMGYENQPLRRECLNTTNNDISNKEVFIHKVTQKKSESENTPLKEPRCFSPLNYLGQLPNGLPVSFISPSDVDMTESAGRLLTAPFHYLCGCSFSLGFVLFFFFAQGTEVSTIPFNGLFVGATLDPAL